MANTENLNIYQKLALIGEPARALQKNKKGYNYKYVSEDVILERITGLMKKHQVSLIPNIIQGTTCITPYHYTKTKATNKGDIYEEQVNEILVNADMNWIWVNNTNPDEKIIIPWAFIGQQSDASQAFGSGLTYSSRYFLLKYFNISTLDDDPDKWRSRQKEFEEEEDRIVAEKITGEIDSYIKDYLNGLSDENEKEKQRNEIVALTKKFAKDAKGRASGNYFNIKDPVAASELLDKVKEIFKIIE